MSKPDHFRFEPAPDLPGSDRVSKYGLATVRSLIFRLWDVTVEGIENVPLDGPGIITPNHLSFCDSVFVPCALPRRSWAIGKGEYMDSWKTKHLFPAFGMIPVDRSGGDAAQAALDTAARVLDAGLLFMIYPEGTRSRSGNLHKGRTGAARLAARCDAPVIPVGHQGTVDVQPPDTFTMKPGKSVTVRFGAPMRPSEFGDPGDPRVLRRFTDAVMFEIAQLSGQRYVDQYASRDDVPDAPARQVITVPPLRTAGVESTTNGSGATDGVPVKKASAPKISVPPGRSQPKDPSSIDVRPEKAASGKPSSADN